MSTSDWESGRADASAPNTSSTLSTLRSKNDGSNQIWLVGRKKPKTKSELSVRVFEVWVHICYC